uniref:KIAA0232 n=1 Tax=Eptatretus burgeri TaxID=7764 RepID=A0A8C4QEU5_EPTBU
MEEDTGWYFPEKGTSIGVSAAAAMSLLQALGPLQTWFCQELEKCGIDAVIYSRYILSLLLQDTMDVELQEQEGTISIWDNGTGRLSKSRKKWPVCLSPEEMKKKAAIQCLSSASEEVKVCGLHGHKIEKTIFVDDCGLALIFFLVTSAEGEGGYIIMFHITLLVCHRYYEAFPALSEKSAPIPVNSTSVWNNRAQKILGSSTSMSDSYSSSSTLLPACTETSSPHEICSDEFEASRDIPVFGCSPSHRESGKENENDRGITRRYKTRPACSRKYRRFRSVTQQKPIRPYSGSSDSSDGGHVASWMAAVSSENSLPRKTLGTRQRLKENEQTSQVHNINNKATRKYGRRAERSKPSSAPGACRHEGSGIGSRAGKEGRRRISSMELNAKGKEFSTTKTGRPGLEEEPQWYTKPLTVLVPQNCRSKLETSYRGSQPCPLQGLRDRSEPQVIAEEVDFYEGDYDNVILPTGMFINGCFVEMPLESREDDASLVTKSIEQEGMSGELNYLGYNYFCEVGLYQSMLDPCASEMLQNGSRILRLIHQNGTNSEEEGCSFGEDHANISSFENGPIFHIDDKFGCLVIQNEGSSEGEQVSHLGDDDKTNKFGLSIEIAPASPVSNVQYSDPAQGSIEIFNTFSGHVLPAFIEETNGLKSSRLSMWTNSQMWDEEGPFSNLSTRTGSPWSHSDDVRSDDALSFGLQNEESSSFLREENVNCSNCQSDEIPDNILNLLPVEDLNESTDHMKDIPPDNPKEDTTISSICGIWLDSGEPELQRSPGNAFGCHSPESPSMTSPLSFDGFFDKTAHGKLSQISVDAEIDKCSYYVYSDLSGPKYPPKAVQRSEYRLWDCLGEQYKYDDPLSTNTNELCKLATEPWSTGRKEDTTFLIGGVYGKLPESGHLHAEKWPVEIDRDKETSVLDKRSDLHLAPNINSENTTLWKSRFAFAQSGLSLKWRERFDSSSSFFEEDCLPYQSFDAEMCRETKMKCCFSSLNIGSPLSHLLSVQCSLQPSRSTLGIPFRPKAIVSSGDDRNLDQRHKLYGLRQTQYRAIRISPHTHFRPIQATELSPCVSDTSDSESERGDEAVSVATYSDLFEQPEADVAPLEEDAMADYHELESSQEELVATTFLTLQLKKGAMEKGAQTSLDSQDKDSGSLGCSDYLRKTVPPSLSPEPGGCTVKGTHPGCSGKLGTNSGFCGMAESSEERCPEVNIMFFSPKYQIGLQILKSHTPKYWITGSCMMSSSGNYLIKQTKEIIICYDEILSY